MNGDNMAKNQAILQDLFNRSTKTRKFGKRRYEKTGITSSKREAETIAKRFRKENINTRIVESKKLKGKKAYLLYVNARRKNRK